MQAETDRRVHGHDGYDHAPRENDWQVTRTSIRCHNTGGYPAESVCIIWIADMPPL
jgi:hypothetical protein